MASIELVAADIGGTHCRFAIARIDDGRIVALDEPVTMETADHASLEIAWQALGETLDRSLPKAAAIALAAPITGDVIKLSNNPWVVRPALVDKELDLDRHILLNDFAAIAHAVAAVDQVHLRSLAGPEKPLPDAGIVSVVGPGTGLGVAALWRELGATCIIPTEGGHADFAPLDEIEDRILAKLRKQHGRVSVERVVSGPGLRTIYEVIADIEGRPIPIADDKTLWAAALDGSDMLASAALGRFCQCLGAVAGDIALAHGLGPVVIAGGLGQRLAPYLPQSGFVERFAAKGRYEALMRSLPIKFMAHPEPGLFGAAAAFAREYRTR